MSQRKAGWLVLLALLVASYQAAAQGQPLNDSAMRAARRELLDSLKQRVQEQANIRKAVQVALDKEAATHAESQIGTVSLNPGNRYPVYSSTTAPFANVDEYFKLRKMNFHLENGRLLRVYAIGEIWRRDSVRRQRVPDPVVMAAGRLAVRLDKAAKAVYDYQNGLVDAAAARRRARGGAVAAAQRELVNRQRDADAARTAWLLANAAARSRSADTVTVDVPATTPPGPRIVTSNEWRRAETVRFTNTTTSIDLNQSATGKSVDFLQRDSYSTPGPVCYVRFLDLVSVVHTSGRRMLTDNANWTLRPNSDTTQHRLTAGTGGLANLVEIALYTDLLSTLNNEDNGLVSTEVASWLPINSRPLWRNGSWFVGTAVRPYLAVSRLDSKFDTLRVNSRSGIDRPNLVQRAYLRFGLNLNLLTWDNRGHVTVQLNTSWMRSISRVAGGVGADTTVLRNAYQNLYGLEMLATVRRQRNFGADLYFTAYLHNVQSRRFIENPDAQWALRPGALFYYYPFGSPSNKLFFRVSNFIFPHGRQRDFVQLQIGYSIGLNSLVSGSGSGDAAVPASVSGAHLPGL